MDEARETGQGYRVGVNSAEKKFFAGLKEKNFCFVRCSFIVAGSVHLVLLCCPENCCYVTVLLGANSKLSRPPHGSSFRWVKLTKHTRDREQFCYDGAYPCRQRSASR